MSCKQHKTQMESDWLLFLSSSLSHVTWPTRRTQIGRRLPRAAWGPSTRLVWGEGRATTSHPRHPCRQHTRIHVDDTWGTPSVGSTRHTRAWAQAGQRDGGRQAARGPLCGEQGKQTGRNRWTTGVFVATMTWTTGVFVATMTWVSQKHGEKKKATAHEAK